MKPKLNFTKDQLLEKEFTAALRGYRADEVDAVLDQVADDYASYDLAIADLNETAEKLRAELALAKSELTTMKTVLKETREQSSSGAQISTLQKMNELQSNVAALTEAVKKILPPKKA